MRRKAILLTIRPDNDELEELIYAQGSQLVGIVRQKRPHPDPQFHLGRGKLEEARETIRDLGASLVIVNAALKPNQIFNLQQLFSGGKGDVVSAQRDVAEARSSPETSAARGPRGRTNAARARSESRRASDGRLHDDARRFDPYELDFGDAAGDARRDDATSQGGRAQRDAASRAAGNDEANNAAWQDAGVEVWDRTRLILEIFRERARSPEARLQVELAQLLYDTPLVKESIHLSKKGEHPGFLGGGEYEVNQYYDMMKKRVTRIKRELEKMRRERGLRRKHRRRGGYHLVSLAGYTNAGKSSLLRALAPAPTVIENRYFSTLSTKTRRADSDKRDILVTDTVGFIEDLPPWLVDAFHSTLEEIAFSDVTLLVLDASDPYEEMARRLRSSLRVLWTFDAFAGRSAGSDMADGFQKHRLEGTIERNETTSSVSKPPTTKGNEMEAPPSPVLADDSAGKSVAPSDPSEIATGAGSWSSIESTGGSGATTGVASIGQAPILVVLNKIDNVDTVEWEEKRARLVQEGLIGPDDTVAISAKTGDGIQNLFDRIYALLPAYDTYAVALPQDPESEVFIAWLHNEADVLSLTRGNEVHVKFEAKQHLSDLLKRRLLELRATPLVELDTQKVNAEPVDADESDEPVVSDELIHPVDSGDALDPVDSNEANSTSAKSSKKASISKEPSTSGRLGP